MSDLLDLLLLLLAGVVAVLLVLRLLRETGALPGEPAPDLVMHDHEGRTVTLSQLQGRWVVLAFYPMAHTPG